MGSGPVQRLMSLRTRTLLPAANRLLKPQIVEGVAEKINHQRQKAKYYYDGGSKELPELKIGQHVRVKPLPSQDDKRWQLVICMQQVAPRSHIVNVGGREYRRNRKFHRATQEQVQEEPSTMEQSTAGTPEPGAELTKAPSYCQFQRKLDHELRRNLIKRN